MPEEQQGSREGAGGATVEPSCRVYVGNLSWRVRWQDLKDHMKQAGEVVRADVFEDYEGKSKGCGIVEYENVEGAQKAIKELTDSELFDRLIFVREDREDAQKFPGSRRGGYGGRGFFFRGSPRYYYGGPSWRGRGAAYRFSYKAGQAGSGSSRVKGEEEGKEAPNASGGGGGSSTAAAAGAGAAAGSTRGSGQVASGSGSGNANSNSGRGGSFGGGRGGVYYQSTLGRGSRRPYSFGGRGGFRGGSVRGGGSFGGSSYGGYRGGRGRYAGGGGGGPPPAGGECSGRQVFISNLPWRTSWQDLKDLFRECGEVVRADVMTMPDGRSKGFGTVMFASPEGAERAVQIFNEYMLDGRPISVRIDRVA